MINFYDLKGNIIESSLLTCENIEKTHGMMARCFLNNNKVYEGFADVYRKIDSTEYALSVGEYIHLWTWDNLNEETHQLDGDAKSKYSQTYTAIKITDILKMDAILYSNPRFGTRLTNTFWL